MPATPQVRPFFLLCLCFQINQFGFFFKTRNETEAYAGMRAVSEQMDYCKKLADDFVEQWSRSLRSTFEVRGRLCVILPFLLTEFD